MENREKGYTLIEMAIALIILGIIIAGTSQAYALYIKREQIKTTNVNLKTAVDQLQSFKQIYGFYPCPAPLTAPRGSATYGQSTDCSVTSIAPGTSPAANSEGINGVAIAASSRTVTTPAGVTYTPRVRIGAIPFRNINIDEKETYDGYGSRLVYALTENMASINTFNALEGGIGVIDASSATGGSMIDPPNSALFAVLSPGRDRVGGYNNFGIRAIACTTGTPQAENCDLGTNAIFRSALESNATGSNYDDRISFFSSLDDMPWARTAANPDDILVVNPGNVGIGTTSPQVKLDIRDGAGNLEGTLRASGRIITPTLCSSSASTPNSDSNCFEPRNIAGDNTSNPANNTPGDGMKCPAGTYMNGIQDGRAICSPVALRCSNATSTMTGVNSTTGAPICSTIPCSSQSVSICSTNTTLAGGAHNTYQTITGGTSRTQTYQCQINGAQTGVSWVQTSASGSCTCSPSSNTTSNIPCGAGFSGNYSSTTTRVCPSGITTTTTTRGAACTCAAQPNQVTNVACPAGQSGGYTDTRVWRCPQANWGPVTRTGSCSCTIPPVTTGQTTTACPDGYNGNIVQNTRFDAASCSWVNNGAPIDSCTCNSTQTRTFTEDPTCQPSEHVATPATIQQVRDGANCTWGTRTVVTPGMCEANTYRWKIVGSPNSSPVSGSVGERVNGSCSYNQSLNASPQVCSASAGNNSYMVYECLCQP